MSAVEPLEKIPMKKTLKVQIRKKAFRWIKTCKDTLKFYKKLYFLVSVD